MSDALWTREDLLESIRLMRLKANAFDVQMAFAHSVSESERNHYRERLAIDAQIWQNIVIPAETHTIGTLDEYILTQILWQATGFDFLESASETFSLFAWLVQQMEALKTLSNGARAFEQLCAQVHLREQDMEALIKDVMRQFDLPKVELKCSFEETVELVHKHKQEIAELCGRIKACQAKLDREWAPTIAAIKHARSIKSLQEELSEMLPGAQFAKPFTPTSKKKRKCA